MALSVPSQSKIPTKNPQPGQTRLFAKKLWRYGKPFGQRCRAAPTTGDVPPSPGAAPGRGASV
jgi:hypothetical protein